MDTNTDDLHLLIEKLPTVLRLFLEKHDRRQEINEIVLDLGRKPEVRFTESEYRAIDLPEVTQDDIDFVIHGISPFNADNRSGIERTLHRISGIRNRAGKVIGLTMRVGRAIEGTIEIVRDIVESPKSVLLLGRPGVGKTTILRETARVLAEDLKKRVIIVDTSNEIAGDGDIPHPGIGSARRMQVPSPDKQHAVMIEAVENHMPEVIIVDEIGTEAEALAARTIAQRGVQLVATAHGHTIDNLLKNPTLSDLLGGIQHVILGDEEAKFRGTQKTVLERKAPPTFDVLIEIRERDVFAIYHDIKTCVDAILRDDSYFPEIRSRESNGESRITQTGMPVAVRPDTVIRSEALPNIQPPDLTIFPFGINVDKVYAAIHQLNIAAEVTQSITNADIVLSVKSQVGPKSRLQQLVRGRQIPIHVLKRNSTSQIVKFLRFHFNLPETADDMELEAVREIHDVCEEVKDEGKPVDAQPRTSFYRRLQHTIAEEYGLNSLSVGEEPNRRVRVYPTS